MADNIASGIVPTLEEFARFKGYATVDEFDAPAATVEDFLLAAADVLVLSTGLNYVPEPDTSLGRMVKRGIMDLAWWIGTNTDSKDEIYSPFSSERIGSYSYQKATQAATKGDDTGVYFFDLALKYLLESLSERNGLGAITYGSEDIFAGPQYVNGQRIADRYIAFDR